MFEGLKKNIIKFKILRKIEEIHKLSEKIGKQVYHLNIMQVEFEKKIKELVDLYKELGINIEVEKVPIRPQPVKEKPSYIG